MRDIFLDTLSPQFIDGKMDTDTGAVLELLPELWQLIFANLGPCSLLTCASVCTTWCEEARSERYWKRHLQRVQTKLGTLRDFHETGLPTWALFKTYLMCPLEPLVQSLWTASNPDEWIVDLTLPHGRWEKIVILISNKTIVDAHFEITIRRNDDRPDTRLPYPGVTCRFDRTVDPGLHRRYHSIVRDSDCVGERDERVWLRLMKA